MKLTTALLALSLAPVWAQDAVTISRYAFVAGQATDAASSFGLAESNPILRSKDGSFGLRGLAFKSALAGGLMAAERLPWFRRHRKFTVIVNLAGAGVSAFATAHNLRARSN